MRRSMHSVYRLCTYTFLSSSRTEKFFFPTIGRTQLKTFFSQKKLSLSALMHRKRTQLTNVDLVILKGREGKRERGRESKLFLKYDFPFLFQVVMCVTVCLAYPQGKAPSSPAVASKKSDGFSKPKLDGYFQYVNVPAPKEYEFGWNRGNPNHFISRYEQSKEHKFRTRVIIQLSLSHPLSFKPSCDTRFQRAFTACCCVFKEINLVGSN